jgi:ADP-ribose pyrophosphatase YjhB (NUDIX family)
MQDVGIGIVEKDLRFIFLERSNGVWTFPSGKVELGESFEAAVLREVKEESGVTAKIKNFLGTKGSGDNKLHYYLCDFVDGDLTLIEPKKFNQVAWKSASEISQIKGDELFVPVRNYLQNLKGYQPV